MNNIPEVKLGIIAVSRDCFPIALSERRRAAIVKTCGGNICECPVTVENESDMLAAVENVKAAAPWQVWSFGPELLDDEGKALTSFNSVVLPNNPRAAIGYVEPGHYYLVEVEGSRGGAYSGSRGMKMYELANLFESLGCRSAYNLDGGRTVGFAWMGELISFPYERSIPDMIYVADFLPGTETEGEG